MMRSVNLMELCAVWKFGLSLFGLLLLATQRFLVVTVR